MQGYHPDFLDPAQPSLSHNSLPWYQNRKDIRTIPSDTNELLSTIVGKEPHSHFTAYILQQLEHSVLFELFPKMRRKWHDSFFFDGKDPVVFGHNRARPIMGQRKNSRWWSRWQYLMSQIAKQNPAKLNALPCTRKNNQKPVDSVHKEIEIPPTFTTSRGLHAINSTMQRGTLRTIIM